MKRVESVLNVLLLVCVAVLVIPFVLIIGIDNLVPTFQEVYSNSFWYLFAIYVVGIIISIVISIKENEDKFAPCIATSIFAGLKFIDYNFVGCLFWIIPMYCVVAITITHYIFSLVNPLKE